MADRYSSDEGAQGTISDLFPNLIVPGGGADAPQDEQPKKEAGESTEESAEPAESSAEPADTNVEPADKTDAPESSAPDSNE
jgi:hypothetical protein